MKAKGADRDTDERSERSAQACEGCKRNMGANPKGFLLKNRRRVGDAGHCLFAFFRSRLFGDVDAFEA
jgi:hypothetical protein